MTCTGPRRPSRKTFPLAAALWLVPALVAPLAPASAQAVDCSALRAALDAAPGAAADPDAPAKADAAMRRQRDEILRTRDYADRTGCGSGLFDDPDSIPCRSLARRIGMLQVGLQRMQDEAARAADARSDGAGEGSPGSPGLEADGRRRDLQARFDAECTAGRTDDATTAMPVDPDAPPGAPAPAGPADKPRAARVLCVRHCDGAFYPLATDVASDRMADMDRICQAQCPSAQASAYAAGGGDGDVSAATASDGSTYSALPAAFGYLKGPAKSCACRAPHQSWAEALAGAEALLRPGRGDVTVTAELAASMAAPVATAKPAPAARRPAAPPASTPVPAPKRRAKAVPPPTVPPLTVPAAPAGRDLTREFRGSDPTL